MKRLLQNCLLIIIILLAWQIAAAYTNPVIMDYEDMNVGE